MTARSTHSPADAVTTPETGPVGGAAAEALPPDALDSVLGALLDAHPDAVAFALDATAGRVPLPEQEGLAGCTPLPGRETTVVEFVVPADRLEVIDCWERARTVGLGRTRVRLVGLPDREFDLTIVDNRHRGGVWIGLLVPDGTAAADSGLDPALLVPSRPRTAEVHKNLYAVITAIDDRTTRMLGWSAAEMVGRRSLEFIHPDDHERAVGHWLEMRTHKQSQRVRLRHRHRDGHWVWVELENTYLGLDDPEVLVAVGHLTDISDEMAAVEAVRQQEKLFRRLTESLPVGVFQIAQDHRIVYANARASTMLGVEHAATLTEQIAAVNPAHRGELADAVGRALTGGSDGQVEVDVHLGRDGRRYLFTLAALSGEEGVPGAIVSVTDVTDGARLREELRTRATYDPLTGCLNRSALLAELERAVAGPGAEQLAVVFVDLDGFKGVNDTHGHAVGDRVLSLVAARLSALGRETDLVGRIGGDEFLLVCPGVTDSAGALTLARRVHDRLRGTFRMDDIRLQLAASVGVTRGRPGATADLLVARSDRAMYEAKRTGRGPVLFDGDRFRPGRAAAATRRRARGG